MCRIGGVVLNQMQDGEVRDREMMTEITEDLLRLLVNMEEALGGDGNGISFHFPDGSVKDIRSHMDSNRLFRHFDDILTNLMDGAIIVQAHARLSTGGSSFYEENLHPFYHGDVVGTHNGTVDDFYLWKDLEKMGVEPYSVVDSEVIFASLNTFANTLHPKLVQTVISDLWGAFAITAVSKRKPNMLLLVRQSNPISYFYNEDDKVFWYASTSDLFPDTLSIPQRTERRYRKAGVNAGKPYVAYINDVTNMESGDGLYVRSTMDGVTIEEVKFDVFGTGYPDVGNVYGSYLNGYAEEDYADIWYSEYYEDETMEGFDSVIDESEIKFGDKGEGIYRGGRK